MNHTSSEVRDCGCHHDGLAGLHDCGPLRTGVVPKLQSLAKLMHGQQRTASHGLWSMLPRFAAAVPGIPLVMRLGIYVMRALDCGICPEKS